MKNLKLKIILFLIIALTSSSSLFSEAPVANLISLNLKEVNIEDALKIISEASGLNVILDNDVKAKITVNLKDVTWQTALDNILKTNSLTYKIQDNIIRVMSLSSLKKEDETLPLTTKIVSMNFAKADEIQKSLTKMLSTRGSIEINIPTNSLIINDSADIISKIEGIISKLDTRTPQVMIEALIVSIKLTDSDDFGTNWTVTSKKRPERHFNQSLLSTAATAINLYYGKTILPGWNMTAQMDFLAEDSRVTILANPRVLTLDNLAAQIEITEQVPYTYVSTSTQSTGTVTSTQFKDIGIKLYVTPHITKDGVISLSVKGEQSFVASFVGTTNEPSIDTRKVETSFMLQDGDTAVIGGLKKKDDTTTIKKVPFLGDIPFLGKLLFSQEAKEIVNSELIFFIAPHIVNESVLIKRDQRSFDDATDELAGLDKEKKNYLRSAAITDTFKRLSRTPLSKKK